MFVYTTRMLFMYTTRYGNRFPADLNSECNVTACEPTRGSVTMITLLDSDFDGVNALRQQVMESLTDVHGSGQLSESLGTQRSMRNLCAIILELLTVLQHV